MLTPEKKAEMIRDQVISKIHWGARDEEALDWLAEQHQITGPEAEALLAAAHRAKRKAVRAKALVALVCSLFGVLLLVGICFLQIWGFHLFRIRGMGLAVSLGVASLWVFIRSLYLLLTGRTDGSVD
jgi:hypothetical protein